jgi:hypothetical protein
MKTYLGDSVYAESNGDEIILTTNDGFGAYNTIYLDSEVIEGLRQLLGCPRCSEKLQNQNDFEAGC